MFAFRKAATPMRLNLFTRRGLATQIPLAGSSVPAVHHLKSGQSFSQVDRLVPRNASLARLSSRLPFMSYTKSMTDPCYRHQFHCRSIHCDTQRVDALSQVAESCTRRTGCSGPVKADED